MTPDPLLQILFVTFHILETEVKIPKNGNNEGLEII